MLLTTIFQYFDISLDGDTDIRVCKPFDAIDSGSISRHGYELVKNKWVLKTTQVPATTEEASDEEATMDTPPHSPTVASSLTASVGSSAAPFDYANDFQNLCDRLDTISLDVQQLQLDHQEDMRTLIGDFQAYREE